MNASRNPTPQSRPLVLIVVTDQRLSERLQFSLSGGGFEVSAAFDNDEAVSRLRRTNPDLVLMDSRMALGEAEEFRRMLHDGSLGRRVPVVLLSDGLGQAGPEADAGAEDCITRPFSPADLILRLRRILDRQGENRALARANLELSELIRKAQAGHQETRERLGEQVAGIRALTELNHAVDPGLEPGEALRSILRRTLAMAGARAGCLFDRPGLDSAWFIPRVRQGALDDRVQDLRLPAAGEFLRILATARRPIRLDEFESIPGTSWEAGILTAAGFSLAVPVIVHHELTGVLALAETPAGRKAFDMDLLSLFASTLGHITETLESREAGNRLAIASVSLLVENIESVHPFFAGHSRRVARLAEVMGRQVGLPSAQIDMVVAAAHLHDVGLSSLQHQFLSHPGPLTVGERDEMRRHPVQGARMAAQAGWPDAVQSAILHHHEKWSGGGYPAGIRRDAIPLPARILAVAEAFDALISPRPYRGPYSESRALALLRQESGLSFDPEMIQAVLTVTGGPEELRPTGT